MENKTTVPDSTRQYLEKIRSQIIIFSLEKPFLALTLVILVCILILPVITISVLMPVVFIIDFSTYVTNHGFFYIMYIVLFQGVVLIVIMISLFLAAFALATSLSVLHSYKFENKEQQ